MKIYELPSGIDQQKPGWAEVIGPFCNIYDLPLEMQQDEGLITLKTSDGIAICPMRQFDPNLTDESGNKVIKIDNWVSMLWQIAKELEIRQLGFGEWSVAGSVLYPLKGSDLSYTEQLFICPDDDARTEVLRKYVARSEGGALWNDIVLRLPNQQRFIEQ